MELITRKVEVSIPPDTHRVDPVDARVSDQDPDCCVIGKVADDRLLLHIACVDDPVRVCFQAVADALFALVGHRGLDEELARRIMSPERGCGHRVKVTAGHGAEV